ncbi:DUF397 domain-containing protein [Actinocorallia populi]|uniref:DUF397 domain-containing protein n=1 Tax=Actinocorallia populi TaxID=2079200 RepID=UPI000D09584A|nr:DUF397 domain-containing protein [Actinocorallia populi]
MVAQPTRHEDLHWRKSTRSADQDTCVEVAGNGETVLVRDSRNPDHGALRLSSATWTRLRSAILEGHSPPPIGASEAIPAQGRTGGIRQGAPAARRLPLRLQEAVRNFVGRPAPLRADLLTTGQSLEENRLSAAEH